MCVICGTAILARTAYWRITLDQSVDAAAGGYRAESSHPYQFMENVTQVKVIDTRGLLNREVGRICSTSADYPVVLSWSGRELQVAYRNGRVLASAEVSADGVVWASDEFSTC